VWGMRTTTRPHSPGETSALRQGAAGMVPLMAGVIPFALVVGAAIADHPSRPAALAGTWLIFSGSAHLATLRLLEDGAGIGAVVLTGLLLNARLLVYSSSIAPQWHAEPLRFKLIGAAAIVDPTWALSQRPEALTGGPRARRDHYTGAALTLWLGWTAFVALGTVAGGGLGPGLGLGAALPICLAGIVAPAVVDRPTLAAVCGAAPVALAAGSFPAGTGLLAAVIAGVVAGLLAEGGHS
jgi:predicted branched-subunit amino acid permease